jgi:hypothetical protein
LAKKEAQTTLQDLQDAGYKKDVSGAYRVLRGTDTIYQKLIADSIGKKYYIDVWVYNKGRHKDTWGKRTVYIFQTEIQFYGKDDEICFNVILCNSEKIESIIWTLLELGYYQRYEVYDGE